jgi:uncharacterized protein YjbI with pentapeptide repeats
MDHANKNTDVNRKSRRKTKKNGCSAFNWAQFLGQLSITIAITIYTIIATNRDLIIAEENRRQDILIANETRYKDLSIAESNRLYDLFLADDQQKENILREYQNFMSELIIKYGININDSAARFSLRYKTLAALEQLDSTRRSFLIRSLTEAKLITYNDELDLSLSSPVIDLNTSNLTGINLSIKPGIDQFLKLSKPRSLALNDVILNQASFRYNHLDVATFINSELNNADFSFSYNILRDQCHFQIINKEFCIRFNNARMSNTNLSHTYYYNIDFSFAEMINVDLSYAKLSDGTAFAHTNLEGSQLYETHFKDGLSRFGNTNMIGINATRSIFDKSIFYEAILINCSLSYSTINNSDFWLSDLTNCQLNNARLIDVKFTEAKLINVNMSNIICSSKCTFSRANLTGAILYNATIMNSNLKNVNFTDQQLAQARSFAGSILPNGTKVPL